MIPGNRPEDEAHDQLVELLSPSRFPNMSPKMAAIVGYIVGESFTEPELTSMTITSDGFVVAYEAHGLAIGHSVFLGAAGDLERNWKELLFRADLTKEQEEYAHSCYRANVGDYRYHRKAEFQII